MPLTSAAWSLNACLAAGARKLMILLAVAPMRLSRHAAFTMYTGRGSFKHAASQAAAGRPRFTWARLTRLRTHGHRVVPQAPWAASPNRHRVGTRVTAIALSSSRGRSTRPLGRNSAAVCMARQIASFAARVGYLPFLVLSLRQQIRKFAGISDVI
jgi:hypothetical protein